MPTSHVTDWRSQGACASADPDLFFPISSTGSSVVQLSQAKAVCAGCRVQPQCLAFAMATHQAHGVWGGTSEEERSLLRDGAGRGAGRGPGQTPRGPGQTGRLHRQPRQAPAGYRSR